MPKPSGRKTGYSKRFSSSADAVLQGCTPSATVRASQPRSRARCWSARTLPNDATQQAAAIYALRRPLASRATPDFERPRRARRAAQSAATRAVHGATPTGEAPSVQPEEGRGGLAGDAPSLDASG